MNIKQSFYKITDKAKGKLGENKYTSLIQLIKFCMVGVLNTLVDWAVYSLFFYLIFTQASQLLDSVAFVLGWCAGIACSYICNKRWTFGQKKKSGKQLLLFIILNAVVLGLGLLCYELLEKLGIIGFPAKAITTPVTLIANFIGNKLIVFRQSEN